MPPKRGRPSLPKGSIVDLTNSRSPSTRSSTRASSQNNITTSRPAKKPRLSNTRSTAVSIKDSEDEDDSMDELSPMKSISKPIPQPKSSLRNEVKSRASLSSVSTIRDSVESSLYSTPGTSAVATPAADLMLNKISVTIPVASSSKNKGLDMEALSALEAELAVKRNTVSLRIKEMRKRKHPDQDEDDEAKLEKLEDASLQLAMSLQQEEDDMANTMQLDTFSSPRVRNSSRPLRPALPKASYVLDSEDEDKPLALSRPRKKSTAMVPDSDDDDDDNFTVTSDESDGIYEVHQSSNSFPSKFGKGPASSPANQRGRPKTIKAETANLPTSRGRGRPSKIGVSNSAASASSATGFARAESSMSALTQFESDKSSSSDDDDDVQPPTQIQRPIRRRRRAAPGDSDDIAMDRGEKRARKDRARLEKQHPELMTMWKELEDLITIPKVEAMQPPTISRSLKPFQLEGLNWMQEMEKTTWGGGLLADEMGMGKTIQAVSLIMSDYPAKHPSLVLIPPVALMQWQQEMGDYTNGTLKTFVYHGTNSQVKGLKVKDLEAFDVILLSYNSLEAMHRKQEKGGQKNGKVIKVKSLIHQIHFHRVILDEAHCIKSRSSNTAKACFALKADHKWCLSGTPLQNRIGELFSLIRFLNIRPFACYFCKQCPCSKLEWGMDKLTNRCDQCNHSGMQHVSVFNQELLNPIQKHGNNGPGKVAFEKLRLLTDRFMLRRIKRDHSSSMELPVKEIHVDRHFFGEEENDFASSIMTNSTRKFETYVNNGVLLNNYANVFGLIMQMRQVADHPDLILKKDVEGGQNILVCCICDEVAEDPVRSVCKHDFCRDCVKVYMKAFEDSSAEEGAVEPDCPRCHLALAVDLEQAAVEQDGALVKKTSIINRIKMENWTSSSKIEALVYDLHELRSRNSSCKSIIFSQFTSMLQLVEWRLHRAGISTVMLDGSMTPAQRQASINHFMTDVDVECFLVSLKAGGVALNLTEASKVFIIDPWWNPAAEWQSADRCHRIGQTRPCSITRLCIEDSVEARMVLLQEKKANMINSTINNDSAAMESLTPEDMQFLFRGS